MLDPSVPRTAVPCGHLWLARSDPALQADLQQIDQLRLHELVVVGNPQDDDVLAPELIPELLRDPVAMVAFHHDDRVGPFDQVAGERLLGVVVGAGRHRLDPGHALADGFGGGAAQAVLAADEQEPPRLGHSAGSRSRVAAVARAFFFGVGAIAARGPASSGLR